MQNVLIATLPLLGVMLGAYLQHIFASSKHKTEQIDLRRNEAYADYLRGVAAIAHSQSQASEDLSFVTDAKSRIAIYGSSEVLALLGKFEETGAVLDQSDSIEAFLCAVEQMRKENFSTASDSDKLFIRQLLFRS